ncbi:hypothetical protein [Dactylosporangium sp. NPDC051484]|uniref:hypothetical protein n=1 Tax=Dactylosporangium sp. NPDC051484 TaxID=3154942 RepID=UPI00344DC2FE
MSMSLYLVKVTPTIGERMQADPELLLQVWGAVDPVEPDIADLDEDEDKLLEDYLGISHILLDKPDRYPWLARALHGTGEVVDFEYGYGPGFIVRADMAAQIVAGLAEEGWWRQGDEVVTVDHAIAAFYAAAADQGRTVIGGIG